MSHSGAVLGVRRRQQRVNRHSSWSVDEAYTSRRIRLLAASYTASMHLSAAVRLPALQPAPRVEHVALQPSAPRVEHVAGTAVGRRPRPQQWLVCRNGGTSSIAASTARCLCRQQGRTSQRSCTCHAWHRSRLRVVALVPSQRPSAERTASDAMWRLHSTVRTIGRALDCRSARTRNSIRRPSSTICRSAHAHRLQRSPSASCTDVAGSAHSRTFDTFRAGSQRSGDRQFDADRAINRQAIKGLCEGIVLHTLQESQSQIVAVAAKRRRGAVRSKLLAPAPHSYLQRLRQLTQTGVDRLKRREKYKI